MKLVRMRPMLRTWDFEGTFRFWQEQLGFDCVARSDEEQWGSLERDGMQVMISGPNEHLNEERAAFTGSLYFDCDDTARLWETLRHSCEVCYPMEDFAYGMREFAIYDNNGYLIQFGEEIPAGECGRENEA